MISNFLTIINSQIYEIRRNKGLEQMRGKKKKFVKEKKKRNKREKKSITRCHKYIL